VTTVSTINTSGDLRWFHTSMESEKYFIETEKVQDAAR
jgi:hypothetical protein